MEIVEQAIENANINAKLNNIENANFLLGDVEKTSKELLDEKPDVIFVDPPRKGLDNKTLDNLLMSKTKKIVYISCNPATLVRDLSKLEEIYDVLKITPIDLFPFTRCSRNSYSVEN